MKCAVLVPVAHTIEPETDDALRVLANKGYAVRVLRGSSQVDLARSTLASNAIRDGFDATMWVDSDILFNPDDVDRIITLNLPFVAGLYPCKGPRRFAGKLKDVNKEFIFGPGGSVIEAEYVGMGFTFIHKSVYDKLSEVLPVCTGGYDGKTVIPFFIPTLAQPTDGPPCYLSEDYSFCLRATLSGFPPKIDTRIRLGHTGKKTYRWADMTPETIVASMRVVMQDTGEIVLKDWDGTWRS